MEFGLASGQHGRVLSGDEPFRSVRTRLPSKPERFRIGWALIPGSGCKPGNELVLWQLTVHVDRLSSACLLILPPCSVFVFVFFNQNCAKN